ncbi:SH3 type 3 domain protein [Roseiflexus castenholzii DSM 13941]|uniref:SH3 type 3 domain protein n=2 Tax=Roseiflexus castenholzii TaxID=120962 RepID=A7NQ33_ROSCS|nr:SH3 type 3 domain protein [Roseiflexus castenholzii DSM 13941]
MSDMRSIIGVIALILALTGCGGIPLPGIGGAPTAVEQPTPPIDTTTPVVTDTATLQPSPEVTPTLAATTVAEAPLPPVTMPEPTTPVVLSPSLTATVAAPTDTPGPTEEPLYLQPSPIPGLPTAPLPTDTPTPSATPTATPVASPTPDANMTPSPTPTPTYPPVPIVSSLRGTVANPGNVRADPNVSATPIDRVNQGEEVQLLGRSDNGRWYLVLTVRGVAGWVSATLLNVPPETAVLVPVNPDIALPTPPGGTP